MVTRRLSWIGLALLSGPAPGQEWGADYRVDFGRDAEGRPEAMVAAVFSWNAELGAPPEELELRMVGGYPGGYAAFVRDCGAFVPAGSEAPRGPFEARVAPAAEGRFLVPVLADGRAGLRYRVALEHDPATGLGADETPHAFADGVVWSGRALFAYHPAAENRVTLNAPAGERATASWNPGKRPGTYEVAGDRLVESFLVVGHPLVRTLELGGSEVQLVLDAPLAPQVERIEDTVRTFFAAAREVYAGPSPPRSVIALDTTAARGVFDGAVYGDDAHLAFPAGAALDEADPRPWRGLLCHESFHLWNPAMVPLAERQMWFSEGFTEYYAELLMARTGLQSGRQFLDAVRGWARDYLAELDAVGELGLLEAGAPGAVNRTLTYQGGALAALCLDVEIRRLSSTGKSLDDLMAALYALSGSGERHGVSLEDLRRLLRTVDGDFLARHVEGSEPLPLAERLAGAGLDFSAERRIVPARDSLWRLVLCSGMVATGAGIEIQRSEGPLRAGDLLVAAGGRTVGDYADLSLALAGLEPGVEVGLLVERGGRRVDVPLTLGGGADEIEREQVLDVRLEPAAEVGPEAARARAALFGALD